MTNSLDVLCVGTVVADLFCDPIDGLPPAGSLQLIDDVLLAAGGCAVNVAICLAKLGLRAGVAGMIGDDDFGGFVRDYLVQRGVDVSALKRDPSARTATTVIINIRGEDRRYLHVKGANATFAPSDVPMETIEAARALYIGGYFSLNRFGQAEVAALLGAAKKSGALTALDVVIPSTRSCSLTDCEHLLPLADVFLPNYDEARRLTGLDDPAAQAGAFCARNPRTTVAVTCGPHGVVARGPDGTIASGAYAMPTVDPSGSGDAFTAGFMAASLEGWPLERKVKFASALGASAVSRKGCTTGVFDRAEALRFISTHQPAPFSFARGGPCHG